MKLKYPILTSLLVTGLASSTAARGLDPLQAPEGRQASRGLAAGELAAKPGGGFFLADPHAAGDGRSLGLARVLRGRIVDVHDVDAGGAVDPTPILRDLVIDDELVSDGERYELQTSPVTQHTRLVIRATFGGSGAAGAEAFEALLKEATELTEIRVRGDGRSELPPFDLVPRDGALVLQFDDLLADGAAAAAELAGSVRILTGTPPVAPHGARIFFDSNHGGLSAGEFHSTRVIVDLSQSAVLPASDVDSSAANVSLRLPTRVHAASGQFAVLTNLAGRPLRTLGAVFDAGEPALPLVCAMRAGNDADLHRGFLAAGAAPRILGEWPARIDAAVDDPAGTPGFDFLVDMTFFSACHTAPAVGHVLETAGGVALEVTAAAGSPGPTFMVAGVHVHALGGTPVSAGQLVGDAAYVVPYETGLLPASLDACWVRFSPQPGSLPSSDVQPASQVTLRFNKPMRAASVTPFDSFVVTRTAATPSPHDIVVADVQASPDLMRFTLTPILPLAHTQGSAETYHVWFGGHRGVYVDLTGAPVLEKPGFASFTLDPSAPTDENGGFVLRFAKTDEVSEPALAAGKPDVRGQISYDFDDGSLRPRPVVRYSAAADRTQAVPALMVPFPSGVQTPLSPLGSKMMAVWRYCDFGFGIADETNHNVDVEGLAWSPVGGQVVADQFPEFEMRLSHGVRLPDESLNLLSLLPNYPQSGLVTSTFADNVLNDPASPQAVVHAKALGYSISPLDVFVSPTGTSLIPWPMNQQGGPYTSYTWRDTAIQAEGGPNGAGIDLEIMETAGLIPPGTAGSVAAQGEVPSIGLPLLMEFRCFPAATAVGLNAFDVSLAINTSAHPSFRVFSTGGFDPAGFPVVKDPELEIAPSGGLDPTTGLPTQPDDTVFYIGQMDLVTRVSRAYTVWIDTLAAAGATSFLPALVEPGPQGQRPGTEVVVAWRGATAIGGASGSSGFAFDADRIDPYGAVRTDAAQYLGTDADVSFVVPGDATWSSDVAALSGARFLQARISFLGNVDTLATAKLSSLAVAYDL